MDHLICPNPNCGGTRVSRREPHMSLCDLLYAPQTPVNNLGEGWCFNKIVASMPSNQQLEESIDGFMKTIKNHQIFSDERIKDIVEKNRSMFSVWPQPENRNGVVSLNSRADAGALNRRKQSSVILVVILNPALTILSALWTDNLRMVSNQFALMVGGLLYARLAVKVYRIRAKLSDIENLACHMEIWSNRTCQNLDIW